jgi:UDPglucose 6-dehydrogenase
MKPGMGDGGGCHPRDNIALRSLTQKLGLEYDIFSTIMSAREEQAKNIAKVLVKLSKENKKIPIIILGGSYKPDVEYLDGSTSVLVAHYCLELGGAPLIDPDEKLFKYFPKCVYLLGHWGKHHDYPFIDGSIIVDPWREFKTDNETITVIQYGNTRNK